VVAKKRYKIGAFAGNMKHDQYHNL